MKIYSLKELSTLLNCNEKTLQRVCTKGELKAYKKLRKWYVLESDLIEWIKS
jgi:excisionase family DNA binding protein